MELTQVRKIVANILCIGLLIAVASPLIITSGFAQTEIDVTVDSSEAIGVNYFSLGVQLDGPDIRIWRDRSSLDDRTVWGQVAPQDSDPAIGLVGIIDWTDDVGETACPAHVLGHRLASDRG